MQAPIGCARVTALAGVLFCWAWCSPACAQLGPGDNAPNFTLNRWRTTTPVKLTDFEGQIVLLDFFAYWCGPCMSASADLEPNLQQYYAARGGNSAHIPVQLVSLSIDGSNPAAVDDFISSCDVELALDDSNGTTFSPYSLGYIPHFAIINCAAGANVAGQNYGQWKIAYSDSGYPGYSFLRREIDSIVLQTPSPRTWLGGTSTDWAAAANWSPSGAPHGQAAQITLGNANARSTLNLSAAQTVGDVTLNSSVGTTLQSAGGFRLTLDHGTDRATINATGMHTISAPVTLASNTDLTVNLAASRLAIGGSIGTTFGTHELTKSGDGTIILSGTNTYTGGTKITSGILRFNNTTSVPASGLIKVQAGGYVGAGFAAVANGFFNKFDKANSAGVLGLDASTSNLDLTGFHASARVGSSTSATLSGTFKPQGQVYRVGGGGGTLTINSTLADTGGSTGLDVGTSGSLPAGTVVLTGLGTYSGTTTVSAGTLRLGAAERLANTSAMNVSGGTLDLQGYDETVGAVTLSSGSIVGTGTLKGTSYSVQGGTISAKLGGTGVLTKTGGGTAVLSGANSYSGGTTVSGGTLAIGSVNALPAGRSLTVGSGGSVVLTSGLHVSSLGAQGVSGGVEPVALPAASIGSSSATPVPEPAALSLLGVGGALALGWAQFRTATRRIIHSARRPDGVLPAPTARRGFTVVELLIVITIIGVLVALLLPAIFASRESARRTSCVNNQSELCKGLHHYVAEKGHLPGVVNGPRKLTWAAVILPYVGRDDLWQTWREEDGTPVLVKVFLCPADAECAKKTAPLSYMVNRNLFLDASADADNYVSLSDVKNPAQTLMLGERPGQAQWSPCPSNIKQLTFALTEACRAPGDCTTTCNISSGHASGSVVTFCDGHVEFVSDTFDWKGYPPGP